MLVLWCPIFCVLLERAQPRKCGYKSLKILEQLASALWICCGELWQWRYMAAKKAWKVRCRAIGSVGRASWYWQESLVLGIGIAPVLAPPPVTHLLSGTVQDGTWTRTHRCVQDSWHGWKQEFVTFIIWREKAFLHLLRWPPSAWDMWEGNHQFYRTTPRT